MASSSSDIANRSSGPSATDFWGKSDAEAKAAYHQLVSMPHLWPPQDTLNKRYGEHAIYEWTDDEYPCSSTPALQRSSSGLDTKKTINSFVSAGWRLKTRWAQHSTSCTKTSFGSKHLEGLHKCSPKTRSYAVT